MRNRESLATLIGIISFGLLVQVSVRLWERYQSQDLRVTFFDVGQGDATLLEFPKGETWLIDAGGGTRFWNWGERRLFLKLARRGILALDRAVVSHPDQDHALGFLGIFRHLTVRELWGRNWSKPLWQTLEGDAATRGIAVHQVEREERQRIGGAEVRVLPATGKTTNDSGLVTEVTYAGCRLLFTGDISERMEEKLGAWFRDADVLKVAHHGSESSTGTTFLAKTRPRWAVISSGLGNRYGHPGSRTLRRLRRRGSEVLRTDFHQEIRFKITSQGDLHCESDLGSCGQGTCRDVN